MSFTRRRDATQGESDRHRHGQRDGVRDDAACVTALSTAAGLPASVTVRYPCNLNVVGINYLNKCTVSATPTGRVQ